MNTESQIYRDLQRHLDELPVGFPATKSGVEIRILKHLFNLKEAEIATQLSMKPEPLKAIHERVRKTGMAIEELEQILDRMVHKGAIFARKRDGKKLYSNALLVVGMFEFQVNRLTEDFLADMGQYSAEAFHGELYRTKIPQLRTIPIEKSIPLPDKYHITTYDDVRQIVENSQGQITVSNCICRQMMDLRGASCTQTDLRESCLQFGDMAEYCLELGLGRAIAKEEVLEILRKAQEAGLVLQPENSQRPEFICCCCGDCCGILRGLKQVPYPADFYASNYYSEVNPELCTGCEECIDICQLDALTMVDSVATINLDRCIGCGNCVPICSSSAIELQKKEEELLPPEDTAALYMSIMSKKVAK